MGTRTTLLAALLFSQAGLLAQSTLTGQLQQHTVHIYPGRSSCPGPDTTSSYTTGSVTIPVNAACNGGSVTAQVQLQFPDTIPATLSSSGSLSVSPPINTAINLSGHWTTPNTNYHGSLQIGDIMGYKMCPDVLFPSNVPGGWQPQRLPAGNTDFSLQRPCTFTYFSPGNVNKPYKVTLKSYVEIDVMRNDDGGLSLVQMEITSVYLFGTASLGTTCPTADATVGSEYSSQLAGTGGSPPYSWKLSGGSLATLTLSSAGLVSGTPTDAGQLDFTVEIDDSAKASALQACTIKVGVDTTVLYYDIVQTVRHDNANVTPIIAGKSALVRIYPSITDPNGSPLAGMLGTLSATGPGGVDLGTLAPLPAQSGTTTARYSPDVNKPDDSFNFIIPQQWLQTGTLHFTATVSNPPSITDPKLSNNTGFFDVPVVDAPGQGTLTVGYLPLCYQPAGADKTCPSAAIHSADALLNKLLPVGDGRVIYLPVARPGLTWQKPLDKKSKPEFTKTIRKLYDLLNAGAPGLLDQLFVWLPYLERYDCGDPQRPPPPANGSFPLGSSDPKWLRAEAKGHVAFGQDSTEFRLKDHVTNRCSTAPDAALSNFILAHEIGHNLGLEHANKIGQNIGCGASGNAAWPYADGSIQQWGYDPLTQRFKPHTEMDLMTYCSPPADNIWISPFDYKKLYDSGLQPQGTPPPAGPHAFGEQASSAAEILIVSGTVSRNGMTGSLDPAYRLPSAAALPAPDPSGNYCLNFTGASGGLGSYCFTVDFEDEDPHTVDDQATVYDQMSFSVRVALPAGTTRVSLVTGSTELAALTATGKSPSLAIVSPKAGASWQSSQNISWSASDPAGRALTYSVLYSSDGGQNWIPVSVDQPDTQYSLDTSQIKGGSNVYFRVMATAGLDTASADVGPITVVQNPAISAPATVDFGGQAPPQWVDQSISISSVGSGPLTISSVTVSNPAFTLLNQPPSFPLPAGSLSGSQRALHSIRHGEPVRHSYNCQQRCLSPATRHFVKRQIVRQPGAQHPGGCGAEFR